MPSIPILATPIHLPEEASYNTLENNRSHYEPDAWELWYAGYRYLKNLTETQLAERHKVIQENLNVFWSEERQKLSVRNVFSSWYWLRKEHLLRYEYKLRGIAPLHTVSLPSNVFSAPARPKRPSFGDILFRFSTHERLVRTLREGHLWLPSGSTFLNAALGKARADDELTKTHYRFGGRSRIITADGHEIKVNGDIMFKAEGPPYYLLSTSMDYHPYLFQAFQGTDACLIIHDPVTFAERLHDALVAAHPGCDFGEYHIHYFDPREPASADEEPHPMYSKDFSYAFEMEWRFIAVLPGTPAADHIEVLLGPLHDIASLYPRPI